MIVSTAANWNREAEKKSKEEKEATELCRLRCFADISGNNKRDREEKLLLVPQIPGLCKLLMTSMPPLHPGARSYQKKYRHYTYLAIFREKSRSTCDKDRSLVARACRKEGPGNRHRSEKAAAARYDFALDSTVKRLDPRQRGRGRCVVLQKTKPANDET